MASAADFADVFYRLILAGLELMSSTLTLMLKVDTADIWNVSLHAAGLGYWLAKPFLGNGGALDVAGQNASALKNFSNMVNYLGRNPETIFGNEMGRNGLSAVMSNLTGHIDENFAMKFWKTAKLGVKVAIKMLEKVNEVIG
ncbi:hypothetical protein [Archaeoglobus neptunius]|uniref:hypothetical protein n=1 Tax=Archaeoglobus neptunius TaxID=2798580 RepID=UPI001928B75F|nr:hypothetical protein [Archaeoglobus neptunius]